MFNALHPKASSLSFFQCPVTAAVNLSMLGQILGHESRSISDSLVEGIKFIVYKTGFKVRGVRNPFLRVLDNSCIALRHTGLCISDNALGSFDLENIYASTAECKRAMSAQRALRIVVRVIFNISG